MASVVPLRLTDAIALRHIRELAANSENIVVLPHAKKRQVKHRVTRPEIENCLRMGFITESPHIAIMSGLWRVNLTSRVAGQELTCAVEIEWATRLLVVTTFRER